ncbi:MAG: hypothetical protein ACJ72X_00425, partial [Nitrososphaeraceae archaeon]
IREETFYDQRKRLYILYGMRKCMSSTVREDIPKRAVISSLKNNSNNSSSNNNQPFVYTYVYYHHLIFSFIYFIFIYRYIANSYWQSHSGNKYLYTAIRL